MLVLAQPASVEYFLHPEAVSNTQLYRQTQDQSETCFESRAKRLLTPMYGYAGSVHR